MISCNFFYLEMFPLFNINTIIKHSCYLLLIHTQLLSLQLFNIPVLSGPANPFHQILYTTHENTALVTRADCQ